MAFFFEFLLLGKKNKNLADKLLAIWMFLLGLHLFLIYLTYKGLDFKYTFILGIQVPFPFLHVPMLFLYTAALTGLMRRWRYFHFLHFIPFIFFYIYYAGFFFMSPEEKIAMVKKLMSGYKDFYSRYSYPAMLLSAITYLTLTFMLIRKHQKSIQDFYSFSSEKINLHWLRNLLVGMTVIWIVVVIANLYMHDIKADVAIYVTVVLFVISMGYFGIRQGNIFTSQSVTENIDKDNSDEIPRRYAKSGLKDDEAGEIQNKLIRLMEEKKLFLDEALSLSKLADQTDVLPNYLSQVINERFGKNFYDYVNSYRVEEFKKLTIEKQNKNKTLFGLALDSGFASKASFNNSFKKFTGQTPSEYVKSLKN